MSLQKTSPEELELQRLESNGLLKCLKSKEIDFAEGERHYGHNGKKWKVIIKQIKN